MEGCLVAIPGDIETSHQVSTTITILASTLVAWTAAESRRTRDDASLRNNLTTMPPDPGMGAATWVRPGGKLMRFPNIFFAGALLFGTGCMLADEEEQRLDSVDDQVEAIADEDQVIDETTALTSDSSAAILEGEADLLGNHDEYWVCWFCYEDKGHDDQGLEGGNECPKEYCYHGKDDKKNKAKKEARDECEDDHDHGCKNKGCKKFD